MFLAEDDAFVCSHQELRVSMVGPINHIPEGDKMLLTHHRAL